jgi:hypothetical protein
MKRGGQPVNDRSNAQRVDTLEEALKLFEAWRAHRKKPERIPEELWAAAVEACREHSIHKVSRTLRLSYSDLKSRIEQVPSPESNVRFVELVPQALHVAESEVVVECDAEGRHHMRLHCRGLIGSGVVDIVKGFFEARR